MRICQYATRGIIFKLSHISSHSAKKKTSKTKNNGFTSCKNGSLMKNKDNPGSKYRRPKEKGTKEHQGHIMCFPHTW